MMFWQFIKNPRKTGALCSSSQSLARAMIDGVGIEKAENIVEIGAGRGVFTKEILRSKGEGSQFFALEINKNFVIELGRKFPNLKVYHQGAENLLNILQEEQINGVDVVVSGLPWSMFSSKNQDIILDAIIDSLRDGGVFSTFAYVLPTPQAKKFRKKLFAKFSSVRISKIVWKNFPPACVYYCVK